MRLEGKVAVVTGASSGIGRSTAEELAAEGAVVVASSIEPDAGREVVSAIAAQGGEGTFVECDVTDPASVGAMIDGVIETRGRIDILVNNAGVNYSGAFAETDLESWERIMAIDLRGAYLCTRAAVPSMVENGGGSVVIMSSVHALAAVPGASLYDTAKAGLLGLTRTLAVELAANGIRVNAISPGLIDTRVWDRNLAEVDDPEGYTEFWMKQIPMARIGGAREVARAAVFLSSDDASYVTGTNLVVDGGLTSRLIPRR